MVYLGGALGVNTFLMYGFFNTVPASIDEAAKIDGAGHARIFFTIILRLVAPILAVVGTAVVHRHLQRVRHRERRAHRAREPDPRRRPHQARLQPALRGLERVLGGCRHGGHPGAVLFLSCRSTSWAG